MGTVHTVVSHTTHAYPGIRRSYRTLPTGVRQPDPDYWRVLCDRCDPVLPGLFKKTRSHLLPTPHPMNWRLLFCAAGADYDSVP